MLSKCGHFEWMDEYIARLEFEGSIDLSVGKTQEPNLPLLR